MTSGTQPDNWWLQFHSPKVILPSMFLKYKLLVAANKFHMKICFSGFLKKKKINNPATLHDCNVAESQMLPVGGICCLHSPSLCLTHLAYGIYLLFFASCWAPVVIWVLDHCLLATISCGSTSLIKNAKRRSRISETHESLCLVGEKLFLHCVWSGLLPFPGLPSLGSSDHYLLLN